MRNKETDLNGDRWAHVDDSLTGTQKTLIESRIAAHELEPASAIPWEQFDTGLKRRLGE